MNSTAICSCGVSAPWPGASRHATSSSVIESCLRDWLQGSHSPSWALRMRSSSRIRPPSRVPAPRWVLAMLTCSSCALRYRKICGETGVAWSPAATPASTISRECELSSSIGIGAMRGIKSGYLFYAALKRSRRVILRPELWENSMSRLAGKVAIVTGGAGGIGAATAHELAREGAAVAVVDIDAAEAAIVAGDIGRSGAQAIALSGDLADESAARLVVESTVAEFGRLDGLDNKV